MRFRILYLTVAIFVFTIQIFSQQPSTLKPPDEDYTWWYITLVVLVLGLSGAIVWKLKLKKQEDKVVENNWKEQRKKSNAEGLTFDADEEMEWLRKNQNIVDRKRRKNPKKPTLNLPNTNVVLNTTKEFKTEQFGLDALDSVPLPVFGFQKVERPRPFDNLPLSNEEALISAIEQTHDEYEEDEEVRDLAVRILAAFRTRNSVEALSQVAIYDLSAQLRSKAISILSEFDHQSVFETILLACADPTREVRAAAARGLTRLSFDRADAWARIVEMNEQGRMRHAARAAVEGGFVERSFDRLIHRDPKYSYEAFVLLSLVLRSGENSQILEALKNHPDKKVRSALVHIIKVNKDQNSLPTLYNLLEDKKLTQEQREEIDKAIEEMSLVAA
ncbi:MAG: hypothetical protein K1X72_01060 [Pyrinomonadaceae bacterium]|nr:hypothetical protein [Pyrinomonadaceae bacterium]